MSKMARLGVTSRLAALLVLVHIPHSSIALSRGSWGSRRAGIFLASRNSYYEDCYEESGHLDHPNNDGGGGTRGGMYRVYFEEDIDPNQTQLDWETCSNGEVEALVLLPPAAVEQPTAVLHFVGGTFFGSTPKLWYRSFLEGVVRNTQCAVVVTPIPVTLFNSPLQHTELCEKLGDSLEMAWTDVLEDEYGDLRGIPLCGVGHSLGARLLVVATTMNQNTPRGRIPPYKSFALISFTNFGASAGIPGVASLVRQSKEQEKVAKVAGERQMRKVSRKARQDWWIDDMGIDDEIDDEWDDLVDDLQGLIQEQASRVKSVLTPKSQDLEFFPTPEMLWKAVKDDKRYCVRETLFIQFDDDQFDQGAKLATLLVKSESSDVKFARIRGNHLSPVSATQEGSGGWLEFPSRASKKIWKVVRGQSKSKVQEVALRDLRQSVARYIVDIVTK